MPHREQRRIAALRDLKILDTPADRLYDDITRLAAEVCDTPMALISLVDEKRQWFKSRVGLAHAETAREHAFCSHAIKNPLHTLVVPDTLQDDRFSRNPLVIGKPYMRFYAGAPLLTQKGLAVGTLCVIDTRPRQLDPEQLDTLQFLASKVVERMEAKAQRT